MKVFISMPMHGKTDEQIKKELTEWQDSFGFNDSEFTDGFIEGHDDMTPLECLAEAIKRIDKSDAIFFADGWEEAAGCRIEMAVAVNYNIPIYK